MQALGSRCANLECRDCSLSIENNGTEEMCMTFICKHPEEAEKIIMGWVAAHPVKTLADLFFELFPNALRDAAGNPRVCPMMLGWLEKCGARHICHECGFCQMWSEPWRDEK